MDLKELTNDPVRRHPWEIARLMAVKRLLAPYIFEGIRILDLGCGDGFIARELFSNIAAKRITAVDIHLTDKLIHKLGNLSGFPDYRKAVPKDGLYDLVLLLDVIEHQENDLCFLAELVTRHIAKGGKILITAPAFQFLFSKHDACLGHYRRYTLQQIVALATKADLNIISSGYLFFSLLMPKLILFKVLSSAGKLGEVGNWHRGNLVSKIILTALKLDASLLIGFSRLGLKIPGLTGWVLCEKPE